MRDLSQHPELLSLNTATVRKQAPLDRIIEAAVARGRVGVEGLRGRLFVDTVRLPLVDPRRTERPRLPALVHPEPVIGIE